MIRSLNRLTLVVLLGFVAVAVSLAYWSVIASDSMLARPDNPRRVEAEQAILRGAIYDRSGKLLAQTAQAGTSPSGKPVVRRDYPLPEAVTAVGYYSLVHGVGGVEAAYDKVLRGDDLRDAGQTALDGVLHRSQVGSDVRLTINAALQQAVAGALKGRRGAVIAVDVPSGAVLAMVSAPSFDPNQLDADYKALLQDPAAPLLNRVTQGIYQPGGALETVILAALLSDKRPLDAPVADAGAPVQVNGLRLTCAGSASAVTTIGDAYMLACPALFAEAASRDPGPAEVQKVIGVFGLLQAPTLVGFETLSGMSVLSLTAIQDSAQLRAQGVGQGDLTVTPLQMVLVAATIANHGNAITPYLVDATRRPGATTWLPIPPPEGQTAVVTQEVADTIQTAMRDAVTKGAAQAANRANLAIYGHASLAFTGPGQNADAWFIGFVELPGGRSVAVAAVIEDTTDAAVAANIGGLALAEAAR